MDGDADTLQAGYVPLAPSRRPSPVSRRWSRCRCRSPTASASCRRGRSRTSLPDAVGAFMEWLVQRQRLDGDRARQPARARAGPAAARLPAVPAVRQLRQDMTRPYVEALEARSVHAPARRRAARSTTARRSRRCAPRSPPSSGPTTSCRSSPRCAARCSPSATRSCSSIATSAAGFTRSACRRDAAGSL